MIQSHHQHGITKLYNMAMTPQEKDRMDKLERLVMSLVHVENVEFIKSAERRLNFLSGTFALADASDVVSTIPTSGQVLKFNGTAWAPGTDNV